MSDICDTDNNPRPTPKKLFNELVIKKKVKAQYGEEFKNGIIDTLQEILGVSKSDLSPAKAKKFDDEVNQFYTYVPDCLKKANRDKKRMKVRFKAYFDRPIVLPEADTVQVCNYTY